MFKFTIRELLLLTAVVGLAAGWTADALRKSALINRMKVIKDEEELVFRVGAMECVLREYGTTVEFVDENSIVVVETMPDKSQRRRELDFGNAREPRSW